MNFTSFFSEMPSFCCKIKSKVLYGFQLSYVLNLWYMNSQSLLDSSQVTYRVFPIWVYLTHSHDQMDIMAFQKDYDTCDPVTSNQGEHDTHNVSLMMLKFITFTKCVRQVFPLKIYHFSLSLLYSFRCPHLCFYFKIIKSQKT